MYSGPSHYDQGDFKKRVDEALAKMQAPSPAETKRRTRQRSDGRDLRLSRSVRCRTPVWLRGGWLATRFLSTSAYSNHSMLLGAPPVAISNILL